MGNSLSLAAPHQSAIGSQSAKFLIFELGNEEFGINVLQVKEIIKLQEITRVPRAPEYMQGVINLRGRIIPVVNLRRRFGMQAETETGRTCIVVVRTVRDGVEQPIGIVVDAVVEVLLLNADEIESRPDFGRDESASFVRGLAKCKGKVKILLDIDEVLTAQEIILAGIASGQ